MWPFLRTSPRQREIRRSLTERRPPWRRALPAGAGIGWVALTAAGGLAAALLVSLGAERPQVRLGQHVPRAIASRVEFQLVDEQQTELMRIRARENSPTHYVLDVSLLESVRGRLLSALALARSRPDDPEGVREEARGNQVLLDDTGLHELLRIAALPESDHFQQNVEQVLRGLVSANLVDFSERAARRTAAEAVLSDARYEPERTVRVAVSKLRFANKLETVQELASEAARVVSTPLRASVQASLVEMLKGESSATPFKPLYRFNLDRTARAEQEAAERVPTQMLVFRPGAPLADPGELDAKELDLLRHEERAAQAAEQARQGAWRTSWLRALGYAALALMIVFGASAYLIRRDVRIFRHPFQQSMALLVLLSLLATARMMYQWTDAPTSLAIGFQALAGAMLTVVSTRGSVLAVCTALALLLTLATREDAYFFLTALLVSGILVLHLREVRNRGKIVAVGGVAALAVALTTGIAGVLQQQTIVFAFRDGLWAGAATLIAAFIIEGTLPGLERLFGFSTSMTLLEWCDNSKPLLRMLAADAPGTYNHSLLVGALAESAADAIGANGLLCRAGAYYHDIGKVNKPEYFVENQTDGSNRHERLSPRMSLLVIVGHVKDGVEMAKEYGVPESIRAFIAEHHGTTLVEYFYHAANRLRKPGDKEVDESEYRYTGPKPQSRETAIVMMCDGVEGAVRAMPEPTPGRIEDVVREIVRKRLMDGQFDDCDLTFRELATIERSLVKSLCGLYHARIEYPEASEKEPAGEARHETRHAS
jgi:putative nucleotidyltransferase with HDIG domain